jgi:hypothetical protein
MLPRDDQDRCSNPATQAVVSLDHQREIERVLVHHLWFVRFLEMSGLNLQALRLDERDQGRHMTSAIYSVLQLDHDSRDLKKKRGMNVPEIARDHKTKTHFVDQPAPFW